MKRLAPILFVACMLGPTSAEERVGSMSSEQQQRLEAWYESLGAPRASESFGHYLARAARIQHGVAYATDTTPPERETLRVELDRFECVSFIESSLAVARCGFGQETSAACFERELERSRYRGGKLDGYASRLHYFTEWIDDNEARGRVRNLTASLGGEPLQREFFHITRRVLGPATLPEAEKRDAERALSRDEARLSRELHYVLDRDRAATALGGLDDGDIVAFVYGRAGLLVHHAGFVLREGGEPRLLHASSFHGRVVITSSDVENYLTRRPERRGVIVARPIAP